MDTKRKVIIDCDPGIDDMFALILCIRHLDVRGILAVGGNTGLEYTPVSYTHLRSGGDVLPGYLPGGGRGYHGGRRYVLRIFYCRDRRRPGP